jgi:hypothetical protein
MEYLGFAEASTVSYATPSPKPVPAPSRLVSTSLRSATTVEEMWDTTELQAESMMDWAPISVDTKRLNKRVRFKVLLGWIVALAAVGAAGYWLYQVPGATADLAVVEVEADVAALDAALSPMLAVTAALTPEFDQITLDLGSATSAVDQTSRDLFAAAADLPDSELALRSNVTQAATDALDASKTLNTAAAYLGAVIPILTGPTLETDPELVELADAAAQFAAWQAHFDTVRNVLPGTVLLPVTEELAEVSTDLAAIQTAYLDGLREGNRPAALQAVRDLEGRLNDAWSLLVSQTESVKSSITASAQSAQESLNLVTR